MTRKLSISFIITLLISLFVANPVLAAKSYYAERFDVQIDLQENGSAIVTETVEFHFIGEPFTFAFREISAQETDGITFLDASMDGVPMSLGTQAGQVEVKAGDPLKVTWHFSPTSDAAHVFTVRYRADGVIRKGDADTMIWRAIPEDHDYSISSSTITLTYPSQATLLEQPTLSRLYESNPTDERIILTSSGLAEDEDLILTARFTPNSLAQFPPQWQTQKEQNDAASSRALPVGFIAGIATIVLGGFGLFTYTRANERDLNLNTIVSTAIPPSDEPPAVIGKLTSQPHSFMGTIFDLAQRGILEVQEQTGHWGTKNHMLIRKETGTSLRPHEQGLLNALFQADETQMNMNQVAARLATKNKLFDEPLEQELIQRGWLDVERKQKRIKLLAMSVITMFITLMLFVASMFLGSGSSSNINLAVLFAGIAGISAGVFILSIALLVYAMIFSELTPSGEEQSARWKGFAEYLKQASKGKEPAISSDYFERYLAYAAVFGLGTSWAKYFQNLGGVPLPIWFQATAGGDADFSAMVAIMSASDSAGASSGGDGGGGGSSGGGSSGAG
ncbi:MAG: DUF2207 domain-containing protein [Anaerolineales bacterium]|nr:DUF2207 domain-containing protein [Anaerolineales bacterium]